MPEPTDQPAKPLRTWRPMALWTAGVLLALGLVLAVAVSVTGYYRNARARWVAKTKIELAGFLRNPPTAFEQPEQVLEDGSCWFRMYRGAMRVGDRGWVYMIAHSMHNDGHPLVPQIGDVSVAVDDAGRFYICYDHVCGGAMMRTKKAAGFADFDEFINSPGFRPGKHKWRPLSP